MLRTKRKSALSILLAFVMLLGVAVLVATVFAPKAEAATAGQYNWRVIVNSKNNTGGWGSDQFRVYGCKTNGTAAQTSSAIASTNNYKIDFKGWRYDTLWCDPGDGEDENCAGLTTDEFPTKITYSFTINGAWAARNLEFYMYLQVKNKNTNTWENVSVTQTHTQSGKASFNGDSSGNYIHCTINGSFGGDSGSGTVTLTVNSSSYPKASSISGGTGWENKTVTANATGGADVETTSVAAVVKDQYGVNWYQDPDWSITDNGWGGTVSVTSSSGSSTKAKVSATHATVAADKTFKIKASKGSGEASITVTVQPTYKINYDTTTNGGTANSYTAGTQVNTSSSSAKVNFKIPSDNKPATSDGWVFNGWATSSSATSGVIPDGSKTIEIDNYNDTIYATYKKTLTINYHYISTSSSNEVETITKDIHNHAASGVITSDQVTDALHFTAGSTKVTYNGVEYTFQGWRTDTNNSTGDGLSTNGQYTVQANNPTVERYAVYSTNNTGHLYYYNENGQRVTKDVTGSDVLVNVGKSNNPTQASFTLPTVNQSTVTIDNRTFTFVGWRADNTDAATKDKNVGDVETRNFKKVGYNYYAVYSGDVTVSYNVNQRYTDGSDDVTGTVPANNTTQYAVANTAAAANALKNTPAIAVNPGNVQLTRVGADQFLGWAIIPNGADTESETAAYPVTLAANASGALTINADTTLTAIFKDSRKAVKAVTPDGTPITENWMPDASTNEDGAKLIRYNYGGRLPYLDKDVIAEQVDGSNHYYFNGWTQNNTLTDLHKTEEIEGEGEEATVKDYYDFSRVKDNVTFTASYTAQTHHWQQDDLASAAVSCNGVAGEGHEFVNGGYHRYCIECGYGENDTVGNYSPNTYVTLTAGDTDYIMIINNRPPTCTAKGSTGKQQCKICFKTIKAAEDVIPLGVLNEHTGRYEHDLQPVEAPGGANYTLKRCTVCGHEERYYNADEHTLIYIAACAATCTEEGYTVNHFFCTDEGCGKRFEDVEAKTEILDNVVINALGHDFQYQLQLDPTCTEDGHEAGYICSRCGELQDPDKLIPATGHPQDEDQYTIVPGYAATCQHTGKADYKKCNVCGTVIEGGEVLEQLEHKLSGIRVVMPSCTEGGRTYRFCENPACDVDADTEGYQAYEVQGSTLNALGHDMKIVAGKAATCTAEGVKDYYECRRCKLKAEDAEGTQVIADADFDEWKVIDALGHDLGAAQTFAPTCTEAGYSLRACSRCNYVERTEGEPAAGHTGGTATCVSKAICDVCNKPYGNYGSHVWDEGVVTTEADCQHRQITTYTCTVPGCNATKIEKGSYGNHDYWVQSQTQPTCTEQGDVVKKCSVCGDVIHEYTNALGHDVREWHMDGTVAKGTCARCGQEVETSPSAAGLTHKCEKCGLVHEGRTGIFVQDGLYCRIIGFFRNLFSMFR